MLPRDALLARLAGAPEPIHVAIDGSYFADARAALAGLDISARPLFLEHQSRAGVAAGPFLAQLDGPACDRLLAVAGIETACVFWLGTVAEPALFRHLRTLNFVRIPLDAAPSDGGTELVLFRHWDPAVLSMMLRVFEPAQRARVFGPIQRLVLYETASAQALVAVARADWPPPVRGFLRISSAQIAQVTEVMRTRSHARIAAFLCDAAPEITAGKSEAALMKGIARSEASARALGIRTERGFGRWAYLMLISKGTIANDRCAAGFVTARPESPDTRLGMLLLGLAAAAGQRDTHR